MVSETELVKSLREVLSTSELARTITSSVLRRKLEEDLGIDLSDRKGFIREQVNLYFRSQIPETQQNEDHDNKGVESSNGKSSRNLPSDGNQKQYNSRHDAKAFDRGAPAVHVQLRCLCCWKSQLTSSSFSGSSNWEKNDVGLSQSMPSAENISTPDHVDNDTLGTPNQQHEREKSCRKTPRPSIKAGKIAQEDGSGSKQPCKKQKLNTTSPPQPTPPCPAHRTFVQDHSDEQQLPLEENLKGRNPQKTGGNRKLAATVTDQDVFDCPVCFEKLSNNVYQCENGHIACDSCCVKINKICPTCSCPIGYRCRDFEKVLEAIQVPCVNAEHGCQQVISYSRIRDHEDMCAYLPCSCPIRKCDFKGTGSSLYQHFDEKHEAVNIRFKYRVSVSLKREKKFIVLREKASGTLFVVKLFSVPQGKVISVVLIGPKSYSGNYRYELTAKDDGVMPPVAMQAPVESVPRLADYRPTRNFLVVEDGISLLNFDIRIRQNQ